MSERYLSRHAYRNTHIPKYEQISRRSCPSAALHLAYKALGIDYPETQIRNDLDMRPKDMGHWSDMYLHAECMGLGVDFFHDLGYEILLSQLYHEPYVMIVGWHPVRNPEYMYHISPVRAIDRHNIIIAETIDARFVTMNKRDFTTLWYDTEGNSHPLLTIRKSRQFCQ
jgi:hypothetical protein